MEKNKEYYKQHIDEFVEDFLGMNLYDYQKAILDKVLNSEDEIILNYPYRHGRTIMKNIIDGINKLK